VVPVEFWVAAMTRCWPGTGSMQMATATAYGAVSGDALGVRSVRTNTLVRSGEIQMPSRT